MPVDLDRLQTQLGYAFGNVALLTRAITHRSADRNHNERLEFLGDALLGVVIALELIDRYPRSDEGDLSRMRASLVNKEMLADIAGDLGLGDYLHLGLGERKSGGRRRASILADALEAVIAAVFLDSDLATCRQVVGALFAERLEQVSVGPASKDSKTALQEWLQARGLPLPVYGVVSVTGEAHAQLFTVACEVTLIPDPVTGSGRSKRLAEQNAAEQLLQRLEQTS